MFLFMFKFKIYYPRRYDKSNASSLRMVITPEINSLLCLLVSHSADTAWHMTLSQIIRLWDFIEYSMVNMYHWCILEPLSNHISFHNSCLMIRQYPLQWQADWLDRPPLADAQAVGSGADWLDRPPLAHAQAVDSQRCSDTSLMCIDNIGSYLQCCLLPLTVLTRLVTGLSMKTSECQLLF